MPEYLLLLYRNQYHLLVALWLLFGSIPGLALSDEPPLLDYKVIAVKDHNAGSFTQGWVKQGDVFYESSGHYGESFIQRYTPLLSNTRYLDDRFFAEGLTLFKQKLYLLTWKENTLLVLNPDTLKTEKKLSYQGEGWGLTHNEQYLIMSNGSPEIFFRRHDDFAIINTVVIPHVKRLNELEYANGILWANDWGKDNIYAINLNQGCILGKIDLAPLRKKAVTPNRGNVTNGIAYDDEANGLWVTGKYWPKRYLIQTDLLHSNKKARC